MPCSVKPCHVISYTKACDLSHAIMLSMSCYVISNQIINYQVISYHFISNVNVMSCHAMVYHKYQIIGSYMSSYHVPSPSVHRLFSQLPLELKSFFFQSFNLTEQNNQDSKLRRIKKILHSFYIPWLIIGKRFILFWALQILWLSMTISVTFSSLPWP